MRDRRMATRAHYRQSHEHAVIAITLVVGVLIGVTVTLGWLNLTGGV